MYSLWSFIDIDIIEIEIIDMMPRALISVIKAQTQETVEKGNADSNGWNKSSLINAFSRGRALLVPLASTMMKMSQLTNGMTGHVLCETVRLRDSLRQLFR